MFPFFSLSAYSLTTLLIPKALYYVYCRITTYLESIAAAVSHHPHACTHTHTRRSDECKHQVQPNHEPDQLDQTTQQYAFSIDLLIDTYVNMRQTLTLILE